MKQGAVNSLLKDRLARLGQAIGLALEQARLWWERLAADQILRDNVAFVENILNSLPVVVGDATQVHQILLNLCVNARDAMLQGGTLSIAVENQQFDLNSAAMELTRGRRLRRRVESGSAAQGCMR